ncbi:MAG: hypothetical protein A3I61_07905 [Acidobacteria bacterium RIFCSPLOWO2_02_FULL_68_18]|nr:MAG: hypothetical protein A3I61_07905 [Acidobacteria bacterium RIFCSPLOWO2_02_FULL_68_18]OFW51167.1 MAG: hypothetical protein A3G77_06005 [Acidobacteria bacterium RIFCSPLOWO2_12_FULL_68_19]
MWTIFGEFPRSVATFSTEVPFCNSAVAKECRNLCECASSTPEILNTDARYRDQFATLVRSVPFPFQKNRSPISGNASRASTTKGGIGTKTSTPVF